MIRNHKNGLVYFSAFAIFFGVWFFLAYLCFPPPTCYVAWIAGLFCGSGAVYLLYAFGNPRMKSVKSDVLSTWAETAQEMQLSSNYPYPFFWVVMAIVEGQDTTEGEEPPSNQLANKIGCRLREAVDLPGVYVTTALLEQYVVSYINYEKSLTEDQDHLRHLKEILEDAHKKLVDADGISVTFLMSDVDLMATELQEGIQQVSDLDWYMHLFSYRSDRPTVGFEHVQQYVLDNGETVASFQSRNMLQLKKQFISCFLDKNYLSAKRLINEIMARSMTESYIRSVCTHRIAFENIKGLIMDATEAVRLQLDVDFFKSIFPDHGVNEVTSMQELQERSNYILDKLIEYESEKRSKGSPENYVQICTYVDDHIYDPTMNISTIALALGMNAPVVSRTFKEYRGITLLDYIHICRINQAKTLICDGKSISETTEMTGFGSIRTFSRVFQKVEGVSPGVYQQEVMNKTID